MGIDTISEAGRKQIKSKARVADHGEVFTGEREVYTSLDLVKQQTKRIDRFPIFGICI